MDYGLQLYSVRDLSQQSLEEAVSQTAQLGYTMLEFAGFFDHTAEQVCAMLKENGVRLSGTHSSINELLQDYEGTLAFHQAIGNRYYIIPSADLSTRELLDAFIDNVNLLQPRLAQEGITLCFHNHNSEFLPNKDGLIPFDELVSRTSIGLEIDTYWAYVAGKDPAELMTRFADRLHFIHIKDGYSDGHGMPLGQGTAPVREVYAKALELGIPMVVESETLTPDGVTEAKICIEFLKSLAE